MKYLYMMTSFISSKKQMNKQKLNSMEWTSYDIEMLEDILNDMKQGVHYPEQIEYLEGLLEKAKQNANPDKD